MSSQVFTTRRTILLVIAVIGIGLATGCGGDSGGNGDDGADAGSLSREDFLEQGNEACGELRRGLGQEVSNFERRVGNRRPRPVLNADVAHYVILPEIEEEAEALRALRLSPGERKRVYLILSAQEQALSRLVFMQRLPSLAVVRRQFAESGAMFREYGLPDCDNGPRA